MPSRAIWVTKGTYNVTGTLQFPNADVVRNGATIVLDGAGSAIQWTTGTNALANFASNSGSLTVKNGKALATKAFTNTGTVVIGPGSNSSLTSPGSGYTQSGGGSSTALTAASSKLASSAASGNVTINGGILSGIGTVQTAGGQSLVNAAAVSPGTSPGILSATANYSQSAGGSLPIQIGGTTVGTQYDRLAVTGNASLNGSLDLSTINGFTPSAGQSFTILTYTGTRTGTFSAITGDTLCSIGIHYQVVYDDAGKQVRLDAKLAPPVVTGYSKAAQAVGKKITVLGSCFTGATQVAFTKAGGGTVNGTGMQVLSDTQISVKVPNLAATGPVSVTGPGGTGVGPILKIKATILDFNPKSGPVGTQVILTGTAFTGVSKVLFGTTKAVFTLDSDGQITTTVPAGAITAVITITTPGGKAKTKVVFTVT